MPVKKINSTKELSQHIDKLYTQFEPSGDFAVPNIDTKRTYATPQSIDLSKMLVGTVIATRGSHPKATYVSKIEQGGKIKIWRNDEDAESLVGPIDAVCSYHVELDESKKVVDSEGTVLYGSVSEKYVLEDEIMRLGSLFSLPFFEYETDSIRRLKVKKPTGNWIDTYELLVVQMPENSARILGE